MLFVDAARSQIISETHSTYFGHALIYTKDVRAAVELQPISTALDSERVKLQVRKWKYIPNYLLR